MRIASIDLSRLQPHPANSNVMAESLIKKLARHIERSGRYPPLIVRPLRSSPGGDYQLLDGHHRVEALRRLKHGSARCLVWDVDDEEALLLLATLNRLEGADDPHKRASLLADLNTRLSDEPLASLLPEDNRALEALLTLNTPPPRPRPPCPLSDMPVAVHFFLSPGDKQRLDARLRAIGGPRERALMQLVEHGGQS